MIGLHYRKALNLVIHAQLEPLQLCKAYRNGLQEPQDVSKKFIMRFKCFVQFLNDTGKRFHNLKRSKTELKDLTLQFVKAKPHAAEEFKAI